MNQRILCITGPTASGKSDLALTIAQRTGAIIVNADSMQCYKALSILTARPTPEQCALAPHCLYGFAHATTPFNTAQWLDAVAHIITHAHQPIIMVGGTGLYFYSLIHGLAHLPTIDCAIRAQVRSLSTSEAWHALCHEDPDIASQLNANDAQRIKRALEVIRSTGKSLHYWHNQPTPPPILQHRQWRGMVVDQPRAVLYAHINQRFEHMITSGGHEEVRVLSPRDTAVHGAIGVSACQKFILGACTAQEAIAQGQQDTRRYAKRQITRFASAFACWPRHAPNADTCAWGVQWLKSGL